MTQFDNRTYAGQLGIAESMLGKMAFACGQLQGCRIAWGKAYQNALNAGLMKETAKGVLQALEPSATSMQECEAAIAGNDQKCIVEIKEQISLFAGGNTGTGNWSDSLQKGVASIEIEQPTYGKFNDFEIQKQMVGNMIDTVDSATYAITQLKQAYDRYIHELQQAFFMVQYTNKLSKDVINPRKNDFSQIGNKLSVTRDDLLHIYKQLQWASMNN